MPSLTEGTGAETEASRVREIKRQDDTEELERWHQRMREAKENAKSLAEETGQSKEDI